MTQITPTVVQSERLKPIATTETITPLSLLDATTANFGLTNAIWFFECPRADVANVNLKEHFRQSLLETLDAYPHFCGLLKGIRDANGGEEAETKDFPLHARRFGRVYVQYGTSQDPGVEFVTAKSSATLDLLCPITRQSDNPIWDRKLLPLDGFEPSTAIQQALAESEVDDHGRSKPLFAVQLTELKCGGFALAAKIAHPLADISALVTFMKDWARISQSIVRVQPKPALNPVFQPALVDQFALGDINARQQDANIMQIAQELSLHRFDWWAPSTACPFPVQIPEPFRGEPFEAAGRLMPWNEWDVAAPVSAYTIHFSREQIDHLWTSSNTDTSAFVSRHDAVLAHVWACIVRARQMQSDPGPVHCDLVYGLRPALKLGDTFVGSPILMMNVELTGTDFASASSDLHLIAHRIRDTITTISRGESLGAFLHSVTFEKSPQRIWQAFLGKRHILVTSWARAGLYEMNFGLEADLRYADGILPALDGNILIKEAPPSEETREAVRTGTKVPWNHDGVDVSIYIGSEAMRRLVTDELLFPDISKN